MPFPINEFGALGNPYAENFELQENDEDADWRMNPIIQDFLIGSPEEQAENIGNDYVKEMEYENSDADFNVMGCSSTNDSGDRVNINSNVVNDSSKPLSSSIKGITEVKLQNNQCNNVITQEALNATVQSMIARAYECEMKGLSDYDTEKNILEELGSCLIQINSSPICLQTTFRQE